MKKVCRTSLVTILIVSMLLIANITGTCAASPIKFTDVKSTSWYYTYVNKLIDLKITSGIGDNKFGPNNNVTRAEFVTFLCKATGLTQKIGYDFNDTGKHWAREWITAAVTANIIDKGMSFEPNKSITRQESVEMLCRALSLQADTDMQTPYADISTNPGYSNTAYKEYLMLGTLSDDKRYFKPTSSITRAETAAVIVNIYDYKTDPDKFKKTKVSQSDADKQEKENYETWENSIKGLPSELLNNNSGLNKNSVYESYLYLYKETGFLKEWRGKYGMNETQFADEIVRVGSLYAYAFANINYKNTDAFKSSIQSIYDTGNLDSYLNKQLTYISKNSIVVEGEFLTSKGLIVCTEENVMKLRGTIRYKYSKPTSNAVLNSEIVKTTNKPSEIGVWYEQDFEINFNPRNAGLKCTSLKPISEIRISN